jgi:NTE family protein
MKWKLESDIIIGVDVQDDLRDRNSLKDATRILVKLQIFIRKDEEKYLETDIYIKPDIKDMGYLIW